MRQLIVLLACLNLCVPQAQAAARFRLAGKHAPVPETGNAKRFGQWIPRAFPHKRATPGKPGIWSNWEGVVSSGMATVAMLAVAPVILGAAFSGFLLIVGVIAALLAVIFGAIGIEKRPKGLAVAGMVLGIIELTVALLAGIFVGLLLLFFG